MWLRERRCCAVRSQRVALIIEEGGVSESVVADGKLLVPPTALKCGCSLHLADALMSTRERSTLR